LSKNFGKEVNAVKLLAQITRPLTALADTVAAANINAASVVMWYQPQPPQEDK